jgi:hypothetical protein
MVSCQEPSPLKGRKHSYQCHPHDTALVSALSFVSMGVEARCRPCHSAAHCWHMKRQPSLHHRHPCRGHRYCNPRRCRRRRCCRQLRRHRCCHCPLPLPSAIAIAVTVDHCHCRLCCIAVSHCRRHRRGHCLRPLPSPSPSAIVVAISIGHHHHRCRQPFLRVVALAQQEFYSTN